jgi:hypothetical protein
MESYIKANTLLNSSWSNQMEREEWIVDETQFKHISNLCSYWLDMLITELQLGFNFKDKPSTSLKPALPQ